MKNGSKEFGKEWTEVDKLTELLQCLKNEHIIVQMHNYPDQDALASAMGLKVLLEANGKKVTIGYDGIIDKENTLKMIELLDIEITEKTRLVLSEDDEIIIVDGQRGNTNVTDFVGRGVACIDHHAYRNNEQYVFCDIRSEVGACSSIIASYFVEHGMEISKNLATALLYGIKMDTHNLTRKLSSLDLEMHTYLYSIASHEKLKVFESFSLRMEDLSSYKVAIDSLRVKHGIGLAGVGTDCSEAVMASVSDFLMTVSSVRVCLVHSRRAGGIKFSVRSELAEVDVSVMIRKALEGLGDGGGHSDMAAGFIPCVPDEDTAKKYIATVEKRMCQLVGYIILDRE